MSAYIRAVLEDCVVNKVDHVTVLDIACAVRSLVQTGQLTSKHIYCIRDHLCGYTTSELAQRYSDWYTLLVEGYALIEHESGITDESFVWSKIALYPRYRKIAPALIRRMHDMGRCFDDLDSERG